MIGPLTPDVRPTDAPEHLLWFSPAQAAGLVSALGWWIFPCGVDKRPACDWPRWPTPYASDVEERWPTAGAAVGVACKPSGLVVIDHDNDAPADWPKMGTHTRLSVNRARPHEFYEQRADRPPIGCPRLTFGDVKGSGAEGGYVVLSDHSDNGQPVIPVPDEIYEAIERHRVGSTSSAGARSRACVGRDLASLIADVPECTASETASRAFVNQHVDRFERHQSPGNRHNEMRSAVAAAFIEAHAGLLDLRVAHGELRASWEALKGEERGWETEYEDLWLGQFSRLEAADEHLLAQIEQRRQRERSLGDPDLDRWVRGLAERHYEDQLSHTESHAAPGDDAAQPTIAGGTPRDAEVKVPDLWLPDAFWSSHPALAEIRRVAVSKRVSPDTVLDVSLARVGAISPHGAELPADDGMAMALGLYVSPIGGSGGGKSTAMKLARSLVPADDEVVDPICPGSGEAIADALFENVDVTDVDGRKKQVRRQTRHNGIVEYSEGSKLFEQSGRSGSTLTSIVRGAFTNDTIGEDLVDKSRARKMMAGDYVLSLVIGFQPEKASVLFDDSEAAAGTPQRFLFSCPARSDRHALREGEEKLRGAPTPMWSCVGPRHSVLTPGGEQAGRLPLSYPVEFCDEALREIERIRNERSMFGARFDPLDAHEPVVLMKTAACLALLLDNKYFVSVERWSQARAVYERSRRVRRWTLDQIRAAEQGSRTAVEPRMSNVSKTPLPQWRRTGRAESTRPRRAG